MAYQYGDRQSRTFFPQSVGEYVGANDPVKVYDAFVDNLDLEELGIVLEENHVGPPPYDPRAMLKLLVYGPSYGIRSSRKLERACHHNFSFIWIMGDLKPDHKTISRFRRKYAKSLKLVLKQCARLCMKLNLIDGNVLFVDGSKFRGNASLNQIWTEERCNKYLKKLDARIDELLKSCDRIDAAESDQPSLVKLKEELRGEEKLQQKIQGVLKELEEENLQSLNSTDKDSVRTKGRQGSHAGYNAQIVTDEKLGLIVSTDVVSSGSDYNEFSRQIENAEDVLGKQAEVACADSGYHQVEDLEKISSRESNTQVVVPSKRQVGNKEVKAFDKANFKYDSENNEYICPEGKRLKFRRKRRKDNSLEYHMKSSGECLNCRHFGVCTKAKTGRTIHRLAKEELREELEKVYESNEGRKIYELRKQKVELPFGHIKHNLGAGYFLLRGQDGVNAEMSLLSTNFNISRMITVIGVPTLLSILLTGGI